jgi:hypothetical protein
MKRLSNPALLAGLAIATLFALTIACHKSPADLSSALAGVRSGGGGNHALAPDAPAASGSPELLAAYQPWFGGKNHINVGYSSQDPAVLQKQIAEARQLGIDGFVVNWYGPRHEYEDKAYMLLQQAAAQSGGQSAGTSAFKTAILYDEDVNDAGTATEKVIVDLQYAYDRYISPHALGSRSAYLRYNGRPVIFIFPKGGDTDWNRIRQLANSWEDPPLLIYKDPGPGGTSPSAKYAGDFDGYYAWVTPGGRGWARDGSNWGQDYLDDFYRRMSAQPNKLAVGAAWPGFNDTLAAWSRNRHMSARCGRTFEDSLRLWRRYFSPDHPLPFLMIVTWNDYEEGTAIERGIDTCGASGQRNGG